MKKSIVIIILLISSISFSQQNISYTRIRDIRTDGNDSIGKIAKVTMELVNIREDSKAVFWEPSSRDQSIWLKQNIFFNIHFSKNQRSIIKKLRFYRKRTIFFKIVKLNNESSLEGNLIKIEDY